MFADAISFILVNLHHLCQSVKLSQIFFFPGTPVSTRRWDLCSAFQQEVPI